MARLLHFGRASKSSSIDIAVKGLLTAVAAVGVVMAVGTGFRPLRRSISEQDDADEVPSDGVEDVSESWEP